MGVNEVQEVIKQHSSKIQENVIPVVTNKIMDSFQEGFECGMDIGCTVVRDSTIEWLYIQLHQGNISVSNMKQLIDGYVAFIEFQRKQKDRSL